MLSHGLCNAVAYKVSLSRPHDVQFYTETFHLSTYSALSLLKKKNTDLIMDGFNNDLHSFQSVIF